jgi:nucleotide-binding universal stress UspA family protein
MVMRPAVLCPTDLSDASRGALRYAAAIAEHFYADLIVLAVNDPLLAAAANARFGPRWLQGRSEQELEDFVRKAFPGRTPQIPALRPVVVTGTPAAEILDTARKQHPDLIVMSTRGASGVRKAMFGSTTERVLRDTSTPVIVTPPHDPGPESLDDWRHSVKKLLVPVDFSHYSERQLHIARGLAEALGATLMLAHVIEPTASRPSLDGVAEEAAEAKRRDASARLDGLARTLPPQLQPEIALTSGDPAREIARMARDHAVDGIVMALHSSIGHGPRMGTVTYRLLCETPVLVIAWPPSRLEHRLRFTRAPEMLAVI